MHSVRARRRSGLGASFEGSRRVGKMSRQYNMYNVQLSEFWKQRCFKESMHNAPYLHDYNEEYDVASEAPSRAPSQLSTTSTVTQQKASAPRAPQPHTALVAVTPDLNILNLPLTCPLPALVHRLTSSQRSWRRSAQSASRPSRCSTLTRRAAANEPQQGRCGGRSRRRCRSGATVAGCSL